MCCWLHGPMPLAGPVKHHRQPRSHNSPAIYYAADAFAHPLPTSVFAAASSELGTGHRTAQLRSSSHAATSRWGRHRRVVQGAAAPWGSQLSSAVASARPPLQLASCPQPSQPRSPARPARSAPRRRRLHARAARGLPRLCARAAGGPPRGGDGQQHAVHQGH